MITTPIESNFFLFSARPEKAVKYKPKSELELRWIQMLTYIDVDLLDADNLY